MLGKATSIAAVALLLACSASPDGAECDLPNVSAEHCEQAHALLLTDELPAARGNRYADNEDAARLGFTLFFDSNLGAGVSCATCHSPELAFADRKAVSKGKGIGQRNSPTTFNSARLSVFFWDGRADSLWSQPLLPIENPVEMASSRLALAHALKANYAQQYEQVFGPLPDMSAWPEAGMPGEAAFDDLPLETQTEVNGVFANFGKALEAYMRKNATSASDLDAFLTGDYERLLEPAQKGLDAFLKYDCVSCHSGPMLTDESFHDVGFPSLPDAKPDLGRAEGLPFLLADPFNLAGPFADVVDGQGPVVDMPTPSDGDRAAFRTPSLRNVALTFPYGHDGALKSLVEVLDQHAPEVDQEDRANLLAFLQTLNGNYPSAPWNNWPSPQ
jgi:cytochrome c peroxidase